MTIKDRCFIQFSFVVFPWATVVFFEDAYVILTISVTSVVLSLCFSAHWFYNEKKEHDRKMGQLKKIKDLREAGKLKEPIALLIEYNENKKGK